MSVSFCYHGDNIATEPGKVDKTDCIVTKKYSPYSGLNIMCNSELRSPPSWHNPGFVSKISVFRLKYRFQFQNHFWFVLESLKQKVTVFK